MNTSEYYTELPPDEFIKVFVPTEPKYEKLNFAESEILQLINKFTIQRVSNNRLICEISSNRATKYLYIYKLPDEWFFVSSLKEQKYYKCDQLQGLIKLLDNYEHI